MALAVIASRATQKIFALAGLADARPGREAESRRAAWAAAGARWRARPGKILKIEKHGHSRAEFNHFNRVSGNSPGQFLQDLLPFEIPNAGPHCQGPLTSQGRKLRYVV